MGVSDPEKVKIHPALRGLREKSSNERMKALPLPMPPRRPVDVVCDEDEEYRVSLGSSGGHVGVSSSPSSTLPSSPTSGVWGRRDDERRGDRGAEDYSGKGWRDKMLPKRALRLFRAVHDDNEEEKDEKNVFFRGTAASQRGGENIMEMKWMDESEEGQGDEEQFGGASLTSSSTIPTNPRAGTAPLRRCDALDTKGTSRSSNHSSVQVSPTSSLTSSAGRLSPFCLDAFSTASFAFPPRNSISVIGAGSVGESLSSPTFCADGSPTSMRSTEVHSNPFSRSGGSSRWGRLNASLSPPSTGNGRDSRRGNRGEAIRVVVRCRPALTPMEKKQEGVVFFHCMNGQVSTRHHADKGKDLCWSMDKAIWSGDGLSLDGIQPATQEDVYAEVGRPLLLHALEGYNSTLLAYGATGSGKTYTMMGGGTKPGNVGATADSSQLGIIPRLCYELFEELEHRMRSYSTTQGNLYQRSIDSGGSYGKECEDTLKGESSGERNVSSELRHGMSHGSWARKESSRDVLVLSSTLTGKNSSAGMLEGGSSERLACVERSVWEVHVRYVEVYCERITDLLNNGAPVTLREEVVTPGSGGSAGGLSPTAYVTSMASLNQNSATTFCLFGAKRVKAECGDDLLRALNAGNKWRHTAATKVNDQSSRSHAIFVMELTEVLHFTNSDGHPSCARNKSLCIRLVDLAGSERISKTGAEGKLFKEAKDINLSLFTLARVIESLAEDKGRKSRVGGGSGGNRPPYRSSTLTKILKDAFGGDSKTTLIATVVPFSSARQETVQTLNYAARARNVVNRPQLGEVPGTLELRKAMGELDFLRKELENAQSAAQQQQFSQERMSMVEASEESRLQHEATVRALQEQLREANNRLRDKEALARQQYEEMEEREANLEKRLQEKENETKQIHSAYEGHMRALKQKINLNQRQQREHGMEIERTRQEAEAQVRDIQEEFEFTELELRRREAEARRKHQELSVKLKKTSSEAHRKLELMEEKQQLLQEELELKEEEARWMEAEAQKRYDKAKEALRQLEVQKLQKEAQDAAALQELEKETKEREMELQAQVREAKSKLKRVEEEAQQQTAHLEAKYTSAVEQIDQFQHKMKTKEEEMNERLREAQEQLKKRELTLETQLKETEEELLRRHKAAKEVIKKLDDRKRAVKEKYTQKISDLEKTIEAQKSALEKRAEDAEAEVKAVEEKSKREIMLLHDQCLFAETRAKEVENNWKRKEEIVFQEVSQLEHGYKKREADLEAILQEQLEEEKRGTLERQRQMEGEVLQSMEGFRRREAEMQREQRERVADLEKAKCDAERRAQQLEREKELVQREVEMKKDQVALMEVEAQRKQKMMEEMLPQLEKEVDHRVAQYQRQIAALTAEMEKRDEELRQRGTDYQKCLAQVEEENQQEMHKLREKWMAAEEMLTQVKGTLEQTQGVMCQEVLAARLDGREKERSLTAALEVARAELKEMVRERDTWVEEVKAAGEEKERACQRQLEEVTHALEIATAERENVWKAHQEAMDAKAGSERHVLSLEAEVEDVTTQQKHYREEIEHLQHALKEKDSMEEEWKEKMRHSDGIAQRLGAVLEAERLANDVLQEEKEQEMNALRMKTQIEAIEEKNAMTALKEELRAANVYASHEKMARLRTQEDVRRDVEEEFQTTASLMTAAAAELRQLREALEAAMEKHTDLESAYQLLQKSRENTEAVHAKQLQTIAERTRQQEERFRQAQVKLKQQWTEVENAAQRATGEVEEMKDQYETIHAAHLELSSRWEETQGTLAETVEMATQLQKEKEALLAAVRAVRSDAEMARVRHEQESKEKGQALQKELTKRNEIEIQLKAAWIASQQENEAERKRGSEWKGQFERLKEAIEEVQEREKIEKQRCATLENALKDVKAHMAAKANHMQEEHLKLLQFQVAEAERWMTEWAAEWRDALYPEGVGEGGPTGNFVGEEEVTALRVAFQNELELYKKQAAEYLETAHQQAKTHAHNVHVETAEEVVKGLEKAPMHASEYSEEVVEEMEKQYEGLSSRIAEVTAAVKRRESMLLLALQVRDTMKRQAERQLDAKDKALHRLQGAYTDLEARKKRVDQEVEALVEDQARMRRNDSEKTLRVQEEGEEMLQMINRALSDVQLRERAHCVSEEDAHRSLIERDARWHRECVERWIEMDAALLLVSAPPAASPFFMNGGTPGIDNDDDGASAGRTTSTLGVGAKTLASRFEAALGKKHAPQWEEWQQRLQEASHVQAGMRANEVELQEKVREREGEIERREAKYREATQTWEEEKKRHREALEGIQRDGHAVRQGFLLHHIQSVLEMEKTHRAELKSRYFHEAFLLQKIQQLEVARQQGVRKDGSASDTLPPLVHVSSAFPSRKDRAQEEEEEKKKEEENTKHDLEARTRAMEADAVAYRHQEEEWKAEKEAWHQERLSYGEREKAVEREAAATTQAACEARFRAKEAAMAEEVQAYAVSLFVQYARQAHQVLCEREQVAFHGILAQFQEENARQVHAADVASNCAQRIDHVAKREKRLGQESSRLAEQLRTLQAAEVAQRAANERDEAKLQQLAEDLAERKRQAEVLANESHAQLTAVGLEKKELQNRKKQVERRARELLAEQAAAEAEAQEAEAELGRRERALKEDVEEKTAQIEDGRRRLHDLEAKCTVTLQGLEKERSQMEAQQNALVMAVGEKEKSLARACEALEKVRAKEQALENLLCQCHFLLDDEHTAKVKSRKTATYLTTELLGEQEHAHAEVALWRKSLAVLRSTGELLCPRCSWKDTRARSACRCCGLSFDVESDPDALTGPMTSFSDAPKEEEEAVAAVGEASRAPPPPPPPLLLPLSDSSAVRKEMPAKETVGDFSRDASVSHASTSATGGGKGSKGTTAIPTASSSRCVSSAPSAEASPSPRVGHGTSGSRKETDRCPHKKPAPMTVTIASPAFPSTARPPTELTGEERGSSSPLSSNRKHTISAFSSTERDGSSRSVLAPSPPPYVSTASPETCFPFHRHGEKEVIRWPSSSAENAEPEGSGPGMSDRSTPILQEFSASDGFHGGWGEAQGTSLGRVKCCLATVSSDRSSSDRSRSARKPHPRESSNSAAGSLRVVVPQMIGNEVFPFPPPYRDTSFDSSPRIFDLMRSHGAH